MSTTVASSSLLDDDLLARFDQRAPQYDRENRFFTEDFEELRASGYLKANLPTSHGGSGLPLADVSRLQRRLGYVAPATAIAVNMHLYWVGTAVDMERLGDPAGKWIIEEAARGKIFAAGHGEVGNEMGLFGANTTATRVDGGWEITGHKIFGSLSPVWDYLGFHAMDASDPEHPVVVHGFLHRDAPRYRIEDTWDTLGMRATASQDTIFDRTFVPDEQVTIVCPVGMAGVGPFHLALFTWALGGFASVYYGLAKRAYDEIVGKMQHQRSNALTRTMAYHPYVQHQVAEMRIALEAMEATLDRCVDEWSDGRAGDDFVIRLLACRNFVIEQGFTVVDKALDLTGGGGAFKRSRIEQLFRDARMGRFHPANSKDTHELVGKLALGVDPDEQPRWG